MTASGDWTVAELAQMTADGLVPTDDRELVRLGLGYLELLRLYEIAVSDDSPGDTA